MKGEELSVKNLSGGYDGRAIFSGISFDAYPGKIIAVIGPNGGGKSTLLKTIAGQIAPVTGEVLCMGESVFGMDRTRRAKLISLLLTERRAAPLMTCRQVVSMGRYPYTGRLGILSPSDEELVDEVMEYLSIKDLSEVYYDKISDGQRQRVLIARALCQRPSVLILDEPATFLDVRYKIELSEILRSLAADGLSVILSMHELSMVCSLSDNVVAVHHGGGEVFDVEEFFSGEKLYEIFDIPKGVGIL